MGKDHLKRLAAPKTWQIKRKGTKFVTKPLPGPHSLRLGMPLNVLLKEILGYAATTREVKKILNASEVKIDGTARKDIRFPVGIFDSVEVGSTGECYRMMLNKKGKLVIMKIKKEEATIKPCKIIGKTMVKGKLQINLYDGKNIHVDNNSYKVGDTVLLSVPDKKIVKHLKLDKMAAIFLIGGKHTGEVGNVEDIVGNKILYKDEEGNLVETLKDYAFVIGDNKPLTTIE